MVTLAKLENNEKGYIESKFQEFFESSAFTFEGIDLTDEEKELKEIYDFITDKCGYEKDKPVTWYTFSGRTMNEQFGLTESNAYKDDLTFLVIPDFYDVAFKLAIPNARWFDDIVCNNRINQNAIDFGVTADLDSASTMEGVYLN